MRLAERVREMEQQNQLLRRQLSISQNQLIQAWGGDREDGGERGGEGTGNKATTGCKDKVNNSSAFVLNFGVILSFFNSHRGLMVLCLN